MGVGDHIPFYVETPRDRMGHSLYMDRNTKKLYRIYNDNHRIFNSAQYWIYVFAGYSVLRMIGDIRIPMNGFVSVMALLILGGLSFWLENNYLYKRSMEKTEWKDVYLRKEEFKDYVRDGWRNARFTVIVFAVCLLLSLIFLWIYLSSPSIELLLIVTLGIFLVGILMRSVPITRMRLHYQESYLEQMATEVEDQLLHKDQSS
ncbi:hypothetical protein [Gracilibacillus timonensis]|uniref:hypothetical protein n=1 Tax=Gracilibacillus timonensis TaxID=1816696 RepID=UPI0008242670|nr:hypothetical protein [Gracilibacillus timonensis]